MGQTIVRKVSFSDGFLSDLPVGHYQVSAVELGPDGTRVRLAMNASGGLQTSLDLKSTGGGDDGVERAFLDLARPGARRRHPPIRPASTPPLPKGATP